MKTSIWAKIFGWAQFGLTTLGTVAQQSGPPHGWAGWLVLVSSLAAAVGIHASASTDGTR